MGLQLFRQGIILVIFLASLGLLGAGCFSDSPVEPITVSGWYPIEQVISWHDNTVYSPQVGLNFIKTKGNDSIPDEIKDVSFVLEDLKKLGVQLSRQNVGSGMYWDQIESKEGKWHLDPTIEYYESGSGLVNVGDLHAMQFASATPPWANEWMELGNESHIDYLNNTVIRFQDHVEYWEPGNEMIHWQSFSDSPVEVQVIGPEDDEFSIEDRAEFLQYVADFIHENDPDGQVMYPGMVAVNNRSLSELHTVLANTEPGTFDVFSYHDYGMWWTLEDSFQRFHETVSVYVDEPRIWITETGATSDPTLTDRTDYPNSPAEQAADVWRRLVLLYGAGAELVVWHTHVSSASNPDNHWRDYGLLSHAGIEKKSYYSFQLLTSKIIPFEEVEVIETGDHKNENGVWAYRFKTLDGDRYVIWSPFESEYELDWSEEQARVINVVPDFEDEEVMFEVLILENENGTIKVPISSTPVLVEQL